MNEELMNEVVNEGVSALEEIKDIESKSGLLPTVAISTGVIVLSVVTYNKLLKPAGKKIWKKLKKNKSETESLVENVVINEADENSD